MKKQPLSKKHALNLFVMAIAFGSLGIGSTAIAAGGKFVNITCDEFLALGPENRNRIAYWMDGYAYAKNEGAEKTIALDRFDQPIDKIVGDCEEDPKATLWEKVRRHF